ncbi:uncharacterized protein LOC131674911, partial [Phymastichus coffea]
SKQASAVLKLNAGVIKIKSKLRSPVKSGLGNPTNRINRSSIVSEDKGIKKSGVVVKDKSQISKMKQQTENLEKKDKKIDSTEPSVQVIENMKPIIDEVIDNSLNKYENGVNGQETSNGNGAESVDINEKEEDFNLQFEIEENGKHEENKIKNVSDNVEQENREKTKETVDDVKVIKDDSPSDTNSCSVDVVESTTSDPSESIESIKLNEDEDKNIESQDLNEDENTDSTKKLKDIQIKLHDCLKDQKNEEENDADQSASEYRHKEDTFGKTLRTLSGRKSIGRHITIQDRQPSPNSSLFVNTSSISVSEDGNAMYKPLYQRTALSELPSSNNGTPLDKKRKLIEEAISSPKKSRIEGSNLLNSSFEFLKYPFSRKAVEVSTPYNFGEVEKTNISSSKEVKADDESGAGRRWCLIM